MGFKVVKDHEVRNNLQWTLIRLNLERKTFNCMLQEYFDVEAINAASTYNINRDSVFNAMMESMNNEKK